MSTIACASGKGGTGKTTVATNLARVLSKRGRVHLLDCDVEGPNDHLFLHIEEANTRDVTIPLPEVDPEVCNGCGLCADACQFNAIALLGDTVLVFSELCHSCGVCGYLCPTGAITERPRIIGTITTGTAGELEFVGGSLNPGEPLAPPIIAAVKGNGQESGDTIIDAAPGTTCPTVEAVRGADYCLLVTEPTPFGLSDLEMAVGMCRRLEVPVGVLINRCDLGDDRVQVYCEEQDIPIVARFPFDLALARAYARGDLVVDKSPEWEQRFEALSETIRGYMEGGVAPCDNSSS